MTHTIYSRLNDVVETTITGTMTKNDIIKCICSIPLFIKNIQHLKLLIDASKCTMDLTPNELKLILEENLKLFSYFDFITIAIVVDNPLNTAFSIIYQRLIEYDQFRFNFFNTKTLAITWLEKRKIAQVV